MIHAEEHLFSMVLLYAELLCIVWIFEQENQGLSLVAQEVRDESQIDILKT